MLYRREYIRKHTLSADVELLSFTFFLHAFLLQSSAAAHVRGGERLLHIMYYIYHYYICIYYISYHKLLFFVLFLLHCIILYSTYILYHVDLYIINEGERLLQAPSLSLHTQEQVNIDYFCN